MNFDGFDCKIAERICSGDLEFGICVGVFGKAPVNEMCLRLTGYFWERALFLTAKGGATNAFSK